MTNDKYLSAKLDDPIKAQQVAQRIIAADQKRSRYRAEVKGLFDGNPPFKNADLRKAGLSHLHNINWRVPEAMLNTALTQYYDAVFESPSFATVECAYDEHKDVQVEHGEIITECFQKINEEDPDLSYMFQASQHDMLLMGTGPVMWEDEFDYRAKPIKETYVPDDTKSNVNQWTICVVRVDYGVEELADKINNEDGATARGWNVAAVRQAIIQATPRDVFGNSERTWENWQEACRRNELYYSQICETIKVAHIFYREVAEGGKDPSVSHLAVTIDQSVPGKFLFRKLNRFDNWRQVICPMYYDVGDGTHYSVKGMGVKAYGALHATNRLMCHMFDAAYANSSIMLQALTEASREQMQVTPLGPYMILPPNWNVIQTQIASRLDEAMAVKADGMNTVSANLSLYRQNINRQKGNPITAREVEYRAENENVIGRAQLIRYFDQLDEFWQERYRRLANPAYASNLAGGEAAERFRKMLKEKKVTKEAIKNARVRATRSIGYGSPDARLQALMRMMARLPLYSETGRTKILEDLTAADVGHALMRRYIPDQEKPPSEDLVIATLQVSAAKDGVAPVVTGDQNHIVFAQIFLKACDDAAGSLQQGANPMEVYALIDILGPAIAAHIEALKADPTRKQAVEQLTEQWKQLAKVHDQLGKQLQQMQQQQQEGQQQMQQAQAIQQGQDPEMALKGAESAAKMRMKAAEKGQSMQLKAAQTKQKMAIADVTTATKIRNQRAQTEAKLRQQAAASSESEE